MIIYSILTAFLKQMKKDLNQNISNLKEPRFKNAILNNINGDDIFKTPTLKIWFAV